MTINYDDEAAWRFDLLHGQEKANGYDDGEAARRVLCVVNVEKRRFAEMRGAGEIGDGKYIDAIAVLFRMAAQAGRIWDEKRNAMAGA